MPCPDFQLKSNQLRVMDMTESLQDMKNGNGNENDVKMAETFVVTSGGIVSYGVDDGDNEPRLKIGIVETDASDSVEKSAEKSKGR